MLDRIGRCGEEIAQLVPITRIYERGSVIAFSKCKNSKCKNINKKRRSLLTYSTDTHQLRRNMKIRKPFLCELERVLAILIYAIDTK